MGRLKELEARIKMLECGVNKGHNYYDGSTTRSVGSSIPYTDKITLKCFRCRYELTKYTSDLSKKEKEAAIKLGLIPKDKDTG